MTAQANEPTKTLSQASDKSLGAWLVLSAFSFMFFLVTAATFTSLGVALPYMIQDLGWNWGVAGAGFSILGIACGLSGYVPAFLIRKWGVSSTILIGSLLLSVGFLSLFSMESFTLTFWGVTWHMSALWAYYIGCALTGVGFTLVATVPGTYVIAGCFERRSFAFGIYFTMGGLGGVAGPALVHIATDYLGDWRFHWLAMFGFTVIGAVFLLAVLNRVAPNSEHNAEDEIDAIPEPENAAVYRTQETWTVRQAMRTPQFMVLCAAYVGFLFIGITVNSFAVGHLHDQGIAAGIAVLLLSGEALINALSRVAGGAIGEFVEPTRLLKLSLAALVVGMVALTYGTSISTLVIFAVGIGVGYGATFLATSVLLLNYFGHKPYLQLFAIMNLAATAGSLAPFVGGYMRDITGSFEIPFLLFALVPLLILLAAARMKPPRLNKLQPAPDLSSMVKTS
ncbi:MAG: MFS transporter [Parvibaculaceae bacterium]|nr:MFS transporter [Parvibaculaceae bacterium]